jgi:hypothetical protein
MGLKPVLRQVLSSITAVFQRTFHDAARCAGIDDRSAGSAGFARRPPIGRTCRSAQFGCGPACDVARDLAFDRAPGAPYGTVPR